MWCSPTWRFLQSRKWSRMSFQNRSLRRLWGHFLLLMHRWPDAYTRFTMYVTLESDCYFRVSFWERIINTYRLVNIAWLSKKILMCFFLKMICVQVIFANILNREIIVSSWFLDPYAQCRLSSNNSYTRYKWMSYYHCLNMTLLTSDVSPYYFLLLVISLKYIKITLFFANVARLNPLSG